MKKLVSFILALIGTAAIVWASLSNGLIWFLAFIVALVSFLTILNINQVGQDKPKTIRF